MNAGGHPGAHVMREPSFIATRIVRDGSVTQEGHARLGGQVDERLAADVARRAQDVPPVKGQGASPGGKGAAIPGPP